MMKTLPKIKQTKKLLCIFIVSVVFFGGNGKVFAQNNEPDQNLHLVFGVSGIVSEVLIKAGDSVTKGQVLAKLSDSYFVAAVESATANVVLTEQALQEAERELERDQLLYDEGSLSGVELENTKLRRLQKHQNWLSAKATYAQARGVSAMSQIKSPADGTIKRVGIAESMNIVAGAELGQSILLEPN